MINRLYEAIASGLKAVRPCKIYREDVPQGFTAPCFLVHVYEQEHSRGINGRLKNAVSLDILYFPENTGQAQLQEECWNVSQDLAREFAIPGFKFKNRNSKIEDKVLHFLCDVDYREFKNDTAPQMQTLIQSERIKEV